MKDSLAGPAFSRLESFQSELKDRLRKETQEVIPMRRWAFIFAPVIPIRGIVDSSIKAVRDRAPETEKLRKKTAWLFTNKQATRANILSEFFGYIDKAVDEFEQQLTSNINTELEKFFQDLEKEVRDFLNRYTDDLTKLDADSEDKATQIAAAKEKVKKLTEQLDGFKRSFDKIEASAGARWRDYNLKKGSI